MDNKNVFLVSLGCDKNLVDSEVMLAEIKRSGYNIVNDEYDADYIIVNTCSFIHDAKEESVNTILEMAQLKDSSLKGIIATGCLTQRYKEELAELIPELDGMLGATNYDEIVQLLNNLEKGNKYYSFKSKDYNASISTDRISDFTKKYAYLKIADGCNNRCTFCIIPSLRGRIKSKSIEDLVEETEKLVENGKSEIIIVAQDTSKYGVDIYQKKMLPELINELSKIEGVHWIRILYCYIEDITDELIEVIKNNEKVVKYLDIPIQHISDNILQKMARRSNKRSILTTLKKLKTEIDGMIIRTSLIVGFPGETQEDFEELYEFVREGMLDKVGVFTYSLEENTKAATMDNQIDEDIKLERRDIIMSKCNELSYEMNSKRLGHTYEVLVEGYIPREDVYIGRTYMDTPTVDGVVFITSDYPLEIGSYYPVKMTDFNDYDLIGEIDESS